MPSDKRHRQRGFSLLEVMFASTILSVIILGMGDFGTRRTAALPISS